MLNEEAPKLVEQSEGSKKKVELNELSTQMILESYQRFRSEVQQLVTLRLTGNLVNIYGDYYSSRPEDVKACAVKLGIDFHISTNPNADKSAIALVLLEADIRIMLNQKKKYDAEMKRLDIELKQEDIRLTNGIETCECFRFFADKKPYGPLSHNWFSQNANKMLEAFAEDSEHPGYIKLEEMVAGIKANWSKIDPQQPLPDIKVWQALRKRKVHQDVKDLEAKHSGN